MRPQLATLRLGLLMAAVLLGKSTVVLASSHSVAILPNHLDGFDLGPYLSYWYDPAEQSTLETAQASLRAGRFTDMQHRSPNLGFARGNHWFHVILQNTYTTRRMILLEVDYPILDQLEFYCFGPSQIPTYFPAGDHLQFDSRIVKVRNYVIPLNLEPLRQTQCLIRTRSQSNVVFPLEAFDTLAYIEKSQPVDWGLGILYGLALALLMYNAVIYLSTREPLYLYFILHVLGGLGYTTAMDGTLANLWISLDLQDVGLLVSICLCAGAGILFGLEYLEIRRVWPLANIVGTVMFMAMMGFSVLVLVAPLMVSYIGSAIVAFIVAIFLLIIGIKRWRDGYAPALFYVIGYGTVLVMVSWMCLNVLVLRADVRWITYGMSLAWLAELLLLSLGLGYRIQETRRERSVLSRQVAVAMQESSTKTEFLAKVSHEVRTPMNGIMGLVELLMSTHPSDEQRRYLTAIKHAGKGLQDVINDVLDYSRIEAGKMVLVPAPFELESLLQDACALYEFEARTKRIELGCFIAEGTPLQLVGDVSRVRQVLLNLLSNALKYTEHGYVHINVQLTDQILADQLVLRFEVEDSGVGIRAQDQRKLFQNFSQIQPGSAGNMTGSGLGLVISQQIVELMGGEMGVKSEFGSGSCFWFHLPLELADNVRIADRAIVLDLFDGAATEYSEPVTLPVKAVPQPQGAGATILVVEDNDINQSVILGFLQKLSIKVELADNGRTAVEMVQRNHHYDLILMDCEMPVMDGYEAASRILKWQQAKSYRPTPIIALSAHALDKHRDMAFEAGMVDYLSKPITFKQLVDKIGRYIDLPVDAALMV